MRDSVRLLCSMISSQGPVPAKDANHDALAGAAFAQELSAKTDPAAVVGEQSPAMDLASASPRPLCGRLAKYGIRRALGKGASGLVVLADDFKNGGKVAIKVMKRPAPGSNQVQHDLLGELFIMRHLSQGYYADKFVTKVQDTFVDGYNYYFVMVRRLLLSERMSC